MGPAGCCAGMTVKLRQSRTGQGAFPLLDTRIRQKAVSGILSPMLFRAAGSISGSPFLLSAPQESRMRRTWAISRSRASVIYYDMYALLLCIEAGIVL